MQRLDAPVQRDRTRDFAAHGGGIGELDLSGMLGKGARHRLAESLPLGTRRADAAAGNFRRENDAPLRRRLGASAFSLVPRRRRQQHDVAIALGEHGRRQHDVVMNPQPRPHQGATAAAGVGQRFEKVAADNPEQIHIARGRMVDHLRGGPAGRGRQGEAPDVLPPGRRGGVDLGHAADFSSALYA